MELERIAGCGRGLLTVTDVELAFATYLHDLEPAGSSARWCTVESQEDGDPLVYVLGEPAALRQVDQAFGVTFEPLLADG